MLSSTRSARDIYSSICSHIVRTEKDFPCQEGEWGRGNFDRYSLVVSDKCFIATRVGATVVYAYFDEDSMGKINKILSGIGYMP